MFALWIAVTFLRPCRRAYWKANSEMRVDAFAVMIFRLSTTPGTTSCSSPAYRSLRVLADDDEIHALEPRRDAGQIPDGPQVRVQVERLAEPDVDAGEPRPDRRRHRPFQRDLVAANRVDELHRQRLSRALERDDAGLKALPFDRHARGGENPQDRFGDFGPDAVAGDERDPVCHQSDHVLQNRRFRHLPRAGDRLRQLFTDVPEQQHETEADVDGQ